MGLSRQEFWSGLPFPSPRDLPDPGIEPGSPALQADSLPYEPPEKPHISENIINQLELINSHLKIGCFHIKIQISLFSWNTGI